MTKFQELDIRTELFFSDQWNSITGDTRGGKTRGFGIDIERGRDDEASQVDPTSVELTLNNCNGRYSSRNPLSPLFGLIGRNTPLRVSVGEPHVGDSDFEVVTTDTHVAPSVTAAQAGLLICAWGAEEITGYTLPGSMTAGPVTDGDFSLMASAFESVAAGPTGTRTATADSTSPAWAAVSVLLNGSLIIVEETLSDVGIEEAASDVTLTTASNTMAGWWLVAIQRWDISSQSQQRFMPNAPTDNEGGWIPLADTGLVEADPSFPRLHQIQAWARRVNLAGEQSVTFQGMETTNLDNHVHLYVLSGVQDWHIRSSVEVSAWPTRWDVSGRNVWVPLTGSGILRRLGQGESPLRSPQERTLTSDLLFSLDPGTGVGDLAPVAYWPLEDGENSNRAASAINGKPDLVHNFTDPNAKIEFAQVDPPGGSKPLPDFTTETLLGSSLSGGVETESVTSWVASFMVNHSIGSGTWSAVNIFIDSGPFARLTIQFTSSQIILLGQQFDDGIVTIGSLSTTINDGNWYWIQLRVTESSGTVFYDGAVFDENNQNIVTQWTTIGNTTGTETGTPSQVRLNRSPLSHGPSSLGHMVIWPTTNTFPLGLVRTAMNGFLGEPAGRRIERLCGEERVPFHPVGDLDESTFMGSQPVETFLNILRECEFADLGILFEPRQTIALGYRTRQSLYNQLSTLELDHDSCHLALPFEPTEDDRLTRNDVTVTQSGGEGEGTSARAVETEGPLSIDNIGRYDTEVNINVASELDLPDQASFRLHLGTVDEARFPEIRIKNIVPPNCPLDEDLSGEAASVDLGDKITIHNPPPQLPPNQIQALAQGYREHLDLYEWDLRFNTSPASPFTIGQRAEDPADPGPIDPVRRDTAGSQLDTQFVAGTDTSMDVETTQGPLWGVTGTSNMHFPFDVYISGARVRVTGVGAAVGQVQTFTVEQIIVNNVNKTIEAGEPVRLWQPATRGL